MIRSASLATASAVLVTACSGDLPGRDGLVDPGLVGPDLPSSRADRCSFEYREELYAWRRLLARWLTLQGGLLPEKRPGDQ